MKRKSTACRIVRVVFLALMIGLLSVTVWAQETTLQTIVPSNHIIHLDLKGTGTILVDGVAYSDSADIQVQRQHRPEISIPVAEGKKIKSVLWGSEDVTSAFENGKWVTPEIVEDVVLTITLEEISSTPQTGDNSNLNLWVVLLSISLIGLVVCLRRSKKEYT